MNEDKLYPPAVNDKVSSKYLNYASEELIEGLTILGVSSVDRFLLAMIYSNWALIKLANRMCLLLQILNEKVSDISKKVEKEGGKNK